MLEIKISELPAATTPLDGTEVFPLVQGVETKKVSIDGLFDQANMGTPASIDLTNATNVPGGGIAGTVAIANGGTGATTAADARTNLGVTATGMDTTYLYRVNNLSDLSSASAARTNLGLGSAAVLTAGAANGVATLDSSGTVPLSQIPAAIQGALNYQGTWNASTNSPTLTSSVGTKGYYYVVNTAGSTNLNGVTDWQIGDWAVFNGTVWQKIDNTDAVTSVNGYTGTVVLTQSDISGTVPITKGGTGQVTQQLAINALAGALTSGYYLRGNGTNVVMSAIQAADVPTLNQNTTGTASNVTGVVAIANGGTGATTAALARTALGLGTIATQDASSVAITGGTINGTSVGATTQSTGKFTNLEATGTFTGSNGIMAIGTSQIYKDASGNVGFGNIVPSEKIDVTGNIKASGSITAATATLSGGTANGVVYLNGSKAVTTGSVLTFDGTTLTSGAHTLSTGNLTFGTTGQRITGDFSNATIANRVMFQTSTANSNTQLEVLTSGTGNVTGINFGNGSDVANTSNFFVGTIGTTDHRLSGNTRGTGTFLPMTFYTSGAEKLRIAADTTGTYTFGGTAPRITGDFSNATLANRVYFQSSTSAQTALGVLPGSGFTIAAVNIFSQSDPANSALLQFRIENSNDARLSSSITGTGTFLPMTFYTGGSERVRIDTSSGNVGIGTSSPSTYGKFAVAGSDDASLFGLSSTTGVLRARAYNTATTGASIEATNAAQSAYANLFLNGLNLLLGTGNTERMRIDSSGNLLVGRTTSNGRLSIQGSGNTFATNSLSIINSAGSNCIYVRDDRQIFADGISAGAGTYALKWQPSGQFTYDTSSARYKNNIRDSQYGLNAVMAMRSRIFEYKTDGRTDIGLVAEEVQTVIPELVPLDKDGKPDAVSYDRMVSVLIKAIQEQQLLIDSLKSRLDAANL